MAERTRKQRLVLRLSQEEQDYLNRAFRRSGFRTRREFFLSCVHGTPIIIGMKDVLTELKRQGINLNQIARAVNGGQAVGDLARLIDHHTALIRRLNILAKGGGGDAHLQD